MKSGVCSCNDKGNPFGEFDFGKYPDKSILTENYGCDSNDSSAQPEVCDGRSAGSVPVDRGCGGDEHGCNIGDSDPAPVRYSSGRVEANPITVFSVPAPADIIFGYKLMYNSEVIRAAAQRNTVNSIHDDRPVIHHSQEDTHFVGIGWLDNYSDRLYVTARNTPSTQITWSNQNGTVTFVNSGGVWKSWSGKFELIDRGVSPPDGYGRWVVRTTDSTAPRKIWAFEEFSYTPYDGTLPQRLGRLRRHAVLTSNLADLNGRYGFAVTWSEEGTIVSAIDTLGREFQFDYHDELECIPSPPEVQPPDSCYRTEIVSKRLSVVRYRPASGASWTTVATLQTTPFPDNDRLERIEQPGKAGYTRFLYQQVPPAGNCVHCNALLTDVIVPGPTITATPGLSAAVQPGEIVSEHDDYGPSPTPGVLVAVHSKSPGREYAYEYTLTQATQFDLTQDGGPCTSSNTCTLPGYACRTANQISPRCYVAEIIQHDLNNGLSTLHSVYGSGAPSPSTPGTTNSFARGYTSNGAPRHLVEASGARTTYGYDSLGRIRCIVEDDNDTQAFSDSTHPDTSACAGPSSSHVIRFDRTGAAMTTTSPGILGATVTVEETLDSDSLLPVSNVMTGLTKDINGVVHSESHNVTTAYDSLGRVILENGPLDDNVAYDAESTMYYESFDPVQPFNLGQIKSTTRYVGTILSNTALTTEYAEYDVFGVPHKIVQPSGEYVAYAPSADRLTWTIATVGNDGIPVGESTVMMNPDGTIRATQDPDGVCVTYEYTGSSGFVGSPTVIRRSNTGCGVIPIDRNSGEVEIRTYVNDDPDRLDSVVRQLDGVVAYTLSGFTYDRDRRLTARSTLDSASNFSFSFTDVLPSGGTAPGGPSPGSWKTTVASDVFARISQFSRFVDSTNRQTYQYAYGGSASPRPTTITRGYNGNSTSVSTFVYDDFGRLLESRVPEAGTPGSPAPTFYEYDVAGRVTKERVGVGTSDVRTTIYVHDSLGRVTSIDHDIEHPVVCGDPATPAGTPIGDAEFTYDGCSDGESPSGFVCANAQGRMTSSRAILQCGSNLDIIKRGRWYAYDSAGRLRDLAYASVTGATVGPVATVSYAYSSAGRVVSYTSPINSAFGTQYIYRASDGLVGGMATTGGVGIASNIGYQPLGRLQDLTTASVQAVDGGVRTLALHVDYRQDGQTAGIQRSFVGGGGQLSAWMS